MEAGFFFDTGVHETGVPDAATDGGTDAPGTPDGFPQETAAP
jgi:hypothetical protein